MTFYFYDGQPILFLVYKRGACFLMCDTAASVLFHDSATRAEVKMTFYDNNYPFYHMRRTAFIFSGHLFTVIVCFLVMTLCLLLILPGIRGKARLLWLFRILLSLIIGAVIVALNFTNNWAEARMTTNATYKSFSNAVVNADIGLHVGLYGINVTLKGNPVVQLNETIDYNEMFSWRDTIEEEYKEALAKGLPNPILYIAEKFTLSSPCGLIFHYRHSGRYASATLWTAFCCWMLANILVSMPVILYAGYMMLATATFIFISTATFTTIMHASQCVFSIGAVSVEVEYSLSFWLALATGLLCTVIGVLVVIMNFMAPEKIKEVFSVGVDSYEDEDISYGQTHQNSAFLDDTTVSPCTFREVTVEHV
ncbi:dual oxidase maturation factor 1 isoform X2 [Phyllopteryx taeniolatus]|uniref:dual oxidase maturation factor 1 isoform X2 n=1 Tax=Phyllopteryx taeniolatus TaxID=161469 RepID=UPI002AD2160D|nr:dual oxidase maturation factor 1 isoform X2 [Phyllopteryx taeniolatus]